MNIIPLVFLLGAALIQLASGIPVVPLFLFWQITMGQPRTVVREFFDALFWAVITGISLGMLTGSMLYWCLVMSASALLLVFVRNYIFTAHTLPTLTLLLLLMITAWRIASNQWASKELFIIFGTYLAIFFLGYAFTQGKKNYQRARV